MRLLFFVLFLFITFLHAENTRIHSISSDFNQTITSTENETLIYEGNFIASKDENLAYWNYLTPNPKQIYFSEYQVIIVEPDLEQAIITRLDQLTDIPSILSDAIDSKEESQNEVEVTISGIVYTIHFQQDLPIKISYHDEIENKVEINLKNTKLNVDIDKTIFNVKLPSNYDIVQY